MIKIFANLLFEHVVDFCRNFLRIVRLRHKCPTLRFDRRSFIYDSIFGLHNAVALNASIFDSKLGDFSYVARDSIVHHAVIGKFTCIGPSVKIGVGNHPVTDFVSIHPAFYSTASQSGVTFSDKQYFDELSITRIGSDVWIGAGAIVRDGITIGDGAIIGAGAVVTKDVPAYAIIGGVPAKIIRYRFDEDAIKKLNSWQWWDKDLSWLQENYIIMQHIQNLDLLTNRK